MSFRAANEKLGEKRAEVGAGGKTPFLCECSDPECTELLQPVARRVRAREVAREVVRRGGRPRRARSGGSPRSTAATRSSRRTAMRAASPRRRIHGRERPRRARRSERGSVPRGERAHRGPPGALGQARSFDIVCECGDAECMERFAITNDAYAALRSDVHRFAVVPGHELPDLERTVERHEQLFRRREDGPGGSGGRGEAGLAPRARGSRDHGTVRRGEDIRRLRVPRAPRRARTPRSDDRRGARVLPSEAA